MIPYIEIINKYTLLPFALIEPNECWFELSYYDLGEFEVRAIANEKNLAALINGNYVKIPNKRFIWVITSIKYTFTAGGSRIIIATGYECKWLLSKRIIKTPLQLPTTLTGAISKLVKDNIGVNAGDFRKIDNFETQIINLNINLNDTQAPRGNLLDFVNNLLKTYKIGSYVIYENGKLYYNVIKGNDKHLSVKFSQSLDNLLSSEYLEDEQDLANYAYVVSTVDDIDYPNEYDQGAAGINRSEIYISSNLNTKYNDADGVERETTPTSDLYKGWQVEEAKKELSKHINIIDVKGEIDLKNSNYEFDKDFFIGDIVGVQDEYFNFIATPRILKYTISQDSKGHYSEAADYGE